MRRLLKIIALGAVAAGVRRFWKRMRSPRRAPAGEPSDAGASEPEPSWWKRRSVRRWLGNAAAILLVLGVGGVLVAASGIVPIKASSGHWAVTRWFLTFSMRRSVVAHTIGQDAPALDDPRLVLKGAGHYETGCRPCHGSPDLPQPRVARQMTPQPPYLPDVVPDWAPEELFYIVKHGVKFTGMPAWPTQQRDDEVWAMVAFLRRLPDMDADAYQRLAEGEGGEVNAVTPLEELLSPQDVPPAVAQSCARCHGSDGLGRGRGAFPRLAGQQPTYLRLALEAFARGARHSGVMEPIAAGLNLKEMRALARYYGRQAPPSASPDTAAYLDVAEAVERGETIANRGLPDQRVPACVDCHGPSPTDRNPAYPLLAGQYADYLILQLELFKAENRGGSAYARLMDPAVHQLTPEQMRDVALFYASLAE